MYALICVGDLYARCGGGLVCMVCVGDLHTSCVWEICMHDVCGGLVCMMCVGLVCIMCVRDLSA